MSERVKVPVGNGFYVMLQTVVGQDGYLLSTIDIARLSVTREAHQHQATSWPREVELEGPSEEETTT